MIITTLVENTSVSDKFNCEHGLSLYIETKCHKLLFDLGASELFFENALKLDVNLADVDTVILSHGHYDHGGGLKKFLKINNKAKIYISQYAFGDYYSQNENGSFRYIGLNKSLRDNPRFVAVNNNLKIDDELELFSGVTERKLNSHFNNVLMKKVDNNYIQDDFSHEQNLIINENDKSFLFAGCAHCGIINIINHYITLKNGNPDCVIGGYHLYNRKTKQCEDMTLINKIANNLDNFDSLYYTCHCTGLPVYKILKNILNDKIGYLSTGSIIKL